MLNEPRFPNLPQTGGHRPKVTPAFVLVAMLGLPRNTATELGNRLTEEAREALIQAYADQDRAAAEALLEPLKDSAQP